MSDVIEVVFEKVARSCVKQLLVSIIKRGKTVVHIECSEDIGLSSISVNFDNILESFLNLERDATLLVNVTNFDVNNIIVKNALLRLLKYNGSYDMEISFEPELMPHASRAAFIDALHALCRTIAAQNDVALFYAGMEPASDDDTRYFTREKKGPLKE